MTTVWIKLCFGKDDADSTVFGIFDFSGVIDQLKKRIKEELKPKLDYIAHVDLIVYPAGTDVRLLDQDPLKLSTSPPLTTSDDEPLIVVAPKRNQVIRHCPIH